MVSSDELAGLAGVNAAKVRKDLSFLGSLGTRGSGYDANFLVAQIERALGADRAWPIIVVGIGNLGRALVNSAGFSSHGFTVAAAYDIDPSVIGTRVGHVVVRHIKELEQLPVDGDRAIGVVATPAPAAQEVADALVTVGVTAILNFAPTVLSVPPTVWLRHVDLSIELQVLAFYQSRGAGDRDHLGLPSRSLPSPPVSPHQADPSGEVPAPATLPCAVASQSPRPTAVPSPRRSAPGL